MSSRGLEEGAACPPLTSQSVVGNRWHHAARSPPLISIWGPGGPPFPCKGKAGPEPGWGELALGAEGASCSVLPRGGGGGGGPRLEKTDTGILLCIFTVGSDSRPQGPILDAKLLIYLRKALRKAAPQKHLHREQRRAWMGRLSLGCLWLGARRDHRGPGGRRWRDCGQPKKQAHSLSSSSHCQPTPAAACGCAVPLSAVLMPRSPRLGWANSTCQGDKEEVWSANSTCKGDRAGIWIHKQHL